MLICISLSFLDLSENMLPQFLSYGATIFALLVFGGQLLTEPPLATPEPPPLPAVGSDVSVIVGIAVFNFAYQCARNNSNQSSDPRLGIKKDPTWKRFNWDINRNRNPWPGLKMIPRGKQFIRIS